MSQNQEKEEGRDEDGGTPPRTVLKTKTAFQIYKSGGTVGSVAAFNVLPDDEALPYRIKASELTLLAALDVVEANDKDRRTYGPATLHAASNYLSGFFSLIPLSGRLNDCPNVSINLDAIQRVVGLYGGTDDVERILARLASAEFNAMELAMRDISTIVDCFNGFDKLLRQEMRARGEKVGVFTRSTVSVSPTEKVVDPNPMDENTPVSSRKVSRKRTSVAREDKTVERAVEVDAAPRSKATKLDGGVKKARAVKHMNFLSPLQSVLFGRLRTLTTQEKKVVTLLNQMIQLVGHVFAVRYNNLLHIFDVLENRVKQAQEIIDAERAAFSLASQDIGETPEPFLNVKMDGILQAIHTASQVFKTDEDCRYELDEDLLHPIAHACMTEVNRIEGFTTAPFLGPSKEALEAKAKAREAARAKREMQRTKALERAKEKEELVAKREEERQKIRNYFGELDPTKLVEDTNIKNPVKTAYVRYGELPLETPEQFERALFIWSMLASLPRPFRLSQMPFQLFLKGLLSDRGRDNGLMEEIVQALLNVTAESLRLSNGPRIVTRGRDWFDSMVEFVGVTSGNNKKSLTQRPKAVSYDDEDDDETNNESDSDSTDELEEEEEEEEEEDDDGAATTSLPNKEEAETEKTNSEPAAEGLYKWIKVTMERVAELRQMAAWGNVDIDDRLNLLQYVVLEALNTPAAQEEAEKLRKMQEESQSAMERQTREIREEAEKEIKLLLRQFSSSKLPNGTTDTYEAKRQQLIEQMEQRLRDVVNEHVGMQDGKDTGAFISPLGMDRYRRIFWRFPFDSHILVQTTAATDDSFPLLREPRELLCDTVKNVKPVLLDDESQEDEQDFKTRNGNGCQDTDVRAPQRVWGTLPPEYLNHFIEGLDPRGIREAALRRSLELIRPYLMNIRDTPQGRITRTRSHAFGYYNKLKLEL